MSDPNDTNLRGVESLLSYDPASGLITWKKLGNQIGGRIGVGQEAGSTDAKGYRQISVARKVLKSHRIAWYLYYGEFPPRIVDHINGDTCDNRISNLRCGGNSVNEINAKAPSTNTSGHRGVSWNKNAKKWMAYLGLDNGRKYLGIFETLSEAVAVREKAELEFYAPRVPEGVQP